MSESGADLAFVREFEQSPAVAVVETDRFCESCGYNLHTQAVRRDPRTQVLLVRCPECGRLAAAAAGTKVAQLWLRRGATLLLPIWILLVGLFIVSIPFVEGVITGATVEELRHRPYFMMASTRPYSARASSLSTAGLPLYLRPEDPWYQQLILLTAAGSFATGFVGLGVVTCLCHHWRRAAYSALAVVAPLLAATVLLWIFSSMPGAWSMDWAAPFIWGGALVQMLGGVAGAMAGRPLARLVIRIVLPPRLRTCLVFLWSVDGRQVAVMESPGHGR